MTIFMMSPEEISRLIASNARGRRLSGNLSQKGLSARSGVSLGVIKKFERLGKISLESLLKLAFCLDCFEDFTTLFKESDEKLPHSIDDLLKDTSRKRGRK